MAPVRLCLLGAGRWGQRYIDTISTSAGVALTALASRNPAAAAFVPQDCHIFTDWREAVRAEDVDAVIVATPPALHAEMALAAIAAGRPVLIEKPLTLSLAEAQAIRDAARGSHVLASVGHIHLHNGGYLTLKRHLPAIGRLLHIRCEAGNWGPFRPDVTPLWDWAPHDLSMCLDLVGSAPIAVNCENSALEQHEAGWAGNFRLTLDFPGDIKADIRVGNMMATRTRQIEARGTKGSLVFDDIAHTLTLRRDKTETTLPVPATKPLACQIDAFAQAVRKRRTRDPALDDGVEIIDILNECEHQLPHKQMI
jgi:predicted dehydrogenase